jgi:hypothetical protein
MHKYMRACLHSCYVGSGLECHLTQSYCIRAHIPACTYTYMRAYLQNKSGEGFLPLSLILPAYTTDIIASEREALRLFLYLSFTLRSPLPLLSLLSTHLHRLSPFLLWCAFAHTQALEATTGIKDIVGAILRAALDLIDADQNGTITRDELKIYGAKVPSLSHACTHLRCRYLSAGISARV